ncbi:MAG: glycosyltransferase family 2 protein [Bacteroidia bacterium]|nr:glycosyltransferase family 2 protein [Bacteroidia bacterium]
MKVGISIIIVSYQVKELLRTCLLSIGNRKNPQLEIIVVDNHSDDGTVEMLQNEFPETAVIKNAFNAGFPAANNQAIRQSSGSYVFLLNPDTEICDDAVDLMYRYMEAHPEIAILAPRLLNPDHSLQFSIQPFIKVREIILEVFYLHRFQKRSNRYFRKPVSGPIPVEAVSGAAMFIRRSTIEKIGMLDEDLFWTEDMEYCYRAKMNGLQTCYFPGATIIHHIGASGKKNPSMMISSQVLTKIRYFKKNHSRITFIIVWFFRFLHIVTRWILSGLLSAFSPAFREKYKAYFFTLKRFLKGDY